MPRIIFTSHLGGIAPEGEPEFPGETVGEVLSAAFAAHPGLGHYIVDDQGCLRKHVIIFADNRNLDRETALTTAVGEDSEVYVLQALSGGRR
ncbi:MAG: MoaD/ThiS family protein [Novosphingobium sp.]|nr:MoaD/ThiS family protein [Novosphingobium sp.]